MFKLNAFILLLILSQIACNQESNDNKSENGNAGEIRTETVVSGYEVIWGMDFLPDSTLIFTERKGNIYTKRGGNVTRLSGFPPVIAKNQGGLLDVKVHPGYTDNGWVYATYSAGAAGGNGQLRVVRFRISGDRVTDVENIWSTDATNSWHGHYGSRLEFDTENHLFISVGEGGSTTYAGPRKKNNNAQELNSPWGKIHRLMDDGRIPPDNPVFEGNSAPGSLWTYGNRNPQGMAFHPVSGELWISEHGPKGGDELNIIRKGANYGWPDYSLGINYDGTEISKGHTAQGITGPAFSWTPSIGVCGITFVKGKTAGLSEGDLLASGLVTNDLHRCTISNGRVTETDPLLSNVGRVRDVAQAPDGSIYVSVEEPGRIIRVY